MADGTTLYENPETGQLFPGRPGLRPSGPDVPPEDTLPPGIRPRLAGPPPPAEVVEGPENFVSVAGRPGGWTPTSRTVEREEGIPDDPRYKQFRHELYGEQLGLSEDMATHQQQVAEQRAQQLREQELEQAEDLQQREIEYSAAEESANQAMTALDDSIAEQKREWMAGGGGGRLFDGGTGPGVITSAIAITFAGLAGDQAQANFMNHFDQAARRAQRAQEFQTNSLFKQLENRLGDRDQARNALEMMQIQYANTQIERFMAENASPEIALRAREAQAALAEKYMANEDAFRTRELGKTKTRGAEAYERPVAGGVRRKTEAELRKDRMDTLRERKLAAEVGKAEREAAGGETADYESSRLARQAAEQSAKTLELFDDVIRGHGGQYDEQGNLIEGTMGGMAGIGITGPLPEVFTTTEGVQNREDLKALGWALAAARKGGKSPSSEDVRRAQQSLRGATDADTAAKLESARREVAIRLEQDRRNIPERHQAEFERRRRGARIRGAASSRSDPYPQGVKRVGG